VEATFTAGWPRPVEQHRPGPRPTTPSEGADPRPSLRTSAGRANRPQSWPASRPEPDARPADTIELEQELNWRQSSVAHGTL